MPIDSLVAYEERSCEREGLIGDNVWIVIVHLFLDPRKAVSRIADKACSLMVMSFQLCGSSLAIESLRFTLELIKRANYQTHLCARKKFRRRLHSHSDELNSVL